MLKNIPIILGIARSAAGNSKYDRYVFQHKTY